KACSDAKILVVKSSAQGGSLPDLFCSGADGVLASEAEPFEASVAIGLLAAGHPYLSPSLRLPRIPIDCRDKGARDFLRLLALGRSTQEIACLLGLDQDEVVHRRRSMLAQLRTPCCAELAKLAIREGLLPTSAPICSADQDHA
ncbi:MAG: DNA-binding NarL/FixJ family response regulator, partial [Planctomycetota bacterium]